MVVSLFKWDWNIYECQTWALGVMESASSKMTSLKAGHGLPLQNKKKELLASVQVKR